MDGIERKDLRREEYTVLKTLLAAVSALEVGDEVLKPRLKQVPNAYRDYRMLISVAHKLSKAILSTVTEKRKAQMRLELRNAHLDVKVVRDVTGKYKPDFSYIPNESLEKLEDMVCDMYCIACEKSEKESRKCKVRQLIESMYAYEFPERNGCPLAMDNIDD